VTIPTTADVGDDSVKQLVPDYDAGVWNFAHALLLVELLEVNRGRGREDGPLTPGISRRLARDKDYSV
jgi:hypothetical protein